MALNPLLRTSYRLFGARAAKSLQVEYLEGHLRRAHMVVRGDAYLATAWFVGLLALILATAVSFVVFVVLVVKGIDVLWGLAFLPAPPLAYYGATNLMLWWPRNTAVERGKDIDMRLPYAAHYVTAMASAGIIPSEIFKSLARQEVYGEVAREAGWIYKDMEVHGKDVVTAMRRAIDRTPSDKFRDFLQGGITTVTSGGDLTAYFAQKARRLQVDNQEIQKQFIETMGLFSEAYITVAVAGPLFLIVLVSVFILMGQLGMGILLFIVYGMVPMTAVLFLVVLKTQIPEV